MVQYERQQQQHQASMEKRKKAQEKWESKGRGRGRGRASAGRGAQGGRRSDRLVCCGDLQTKVPKQNTHLPLHQHYCHLIYTDHLYRCLDSSSCPQFCNIVPFAFARAGDNLSHAFAALAPP